jgi:di/tricarboxylate transporter
VPALIVGSLFVALVGRHLLPKEVPQHYRESWQTVGTMLRFDYEIEKHQFQLVVRNDSPLIGQTLKEVSLGAVLGLNVYAVQRGKQTYADIGAEFVLEGGDILFIRGSIDEFRSFLNWRAFEMARGAEISELLALQKVAFLEVVIGDGCDLVGQSVEALGFASRFSGYILSVIREGEEFRSGIPSMVLNVGDRLLIETREENLGLYQDADCFSEVVQLDRDALNHVYDESQTLFELEIPEWSHFAGRNISETRIGEVLHLRVVGIARKSGSSYFPVGDDVFRAGDKLLVEGSQKTEKLLSALQTLEARENKELGDLAESGMSLTEVTLSPQSSLAEKMIKELDFRRRYGLQIQAIWRQGKVLSSGLWREKLKLGDAILLSGPADRIEDLTKDPDFLVLNQRSQKSARVTSKPKAIIASCVMLGVVGLVLFGVLPIAVAAIAGVVVMVVFQCLDMDEAYRAIEWQSVFLIACMIPMGTAMQESGAAQWIAQGVVYVAEPFGVWGMIVGLYVLTSLATTIVPTTALVLIMAPIAIGAAERFGLPPHMIMMAVAMAASASFTSPISHPANVMVMGPGGYRFVDYVKMGVLLAIVVMLTVLPMIALQRW